MIRKSGHTAVLLAVPLRGGAQEAAGEADPWGFDDLDDPEPGLLELAWDQALDIGLFAVFAAFALIGFSRRSRSLKYATLVVSVLYLGVYKSQLLSITNLFAALTANLPIFSYSMAWYAFAAFAIGTTVVWGRLYCGRICAFGALTQLIDSLVPRRWQIEIPPAIERRAGFVKYAILLGALGWFLISRDIAFYRYIEPFWMFTFQATTPLWIGLGALLVASVFVRNLYCRFLCPVGAALGLLSTLSIRRIERWPECGQCKVCENECEWGAIRRRKILVTECVRCDDCELLGADRERCPHWLLDAKRRRSSERHEPSGVRPAGAGPSPFEAAGPNPSEAAGPKPSEAAGPEPSEAASPKPSEAAGPNPFNAAGPTSSGGARSPVMSEHRVDVSRIGRGGRPARSK